MILYGNKNILFFIFEFSPRELKLPRNNTFPVSGSIYDFYFDKNNFGTWHSWNKKIPELEIPPDAKVNFFLFSHFSFKYSLNNFLRVSYG